MDGVTAATHAESMTTIKEVGDIVTTAHGYHMLQIIRRYFMRYSQWKEAGCYQTSALCRLSIKLHTQGLQQNAHKLPKSRLLQNKLKK